MSSPEEELAPILQQMSAFHLKWVALNDKCKSLQSCLNEANCKNEELEVKLAQCTEQSAKKEEENEKLIAIVKKLRKKLLTGSVHKLINALKQNIRAYDEAVLPSISELTKNVTINNDDSDISNSEDENDPESSSLTTVNISSKPVNSSINQIQDPRLKSVIVSSGFNGNKVTNDTPMFVALLAKNSSVSSVMSVSPSARNIENIKVADTSCNSKISSPCIVISSTTGEKHSEAKVISKNSSCADKSISPTSSSQSNNTYTTNATETGSDAVTQVNAISESLKDTVQPCFVNVSNIESLSLVKDQLADSCEENTPNTDLLKQVSLDLNDEFSLNQNVDSDGTTNRKNSDEKPDDVLMCSPSMVISKVSKDSISCEMIDVEMSDIETIQSERFKRPCSSPSSMFESSPKRCAIEKSSSSYSTPPWSCGNAKTNHLKCLICEYEDMDNDKTYETYLMLDNHIIEKHPNPFPPYVRCMFNNGQCTRHFHPKQNFHKHVKRAHSLDDPVLTSETNQRKPLKCASCNKLFLFQSDIQEHNAQIHGTTSNKKKMIGKLCRKKSVEHSQSTSTWVRPMAECEVCKKDNRLNVKYKLYDELDAHISKCHSDPFPDYFRCPYCKRHFKMVKWLTSHIMKKHPDKYSKSPLEKFLPFETPEEEYEQTTINVADTPVGSPISTARENLSLRILSPSTINKAISAVVTSFSASKSN